MIARGWIPSPHGVKADEMIILRGRQGTRKSSFLRAIVGDEYYDDSEILREPDTNHRVQRGKGLLIVECPDIDSTKDKKGFAELKGNQSKLSETTRLAWQYSPHKYIRTFIFTGTANEFRVINDPTGGRRFWIMTPTLAAEAGAADRTAINTEWMIENRDQLLGEIINGYGLRELCEEATSGAAEWDNAYFDSFLQVPDELYRWHSQNESQHAYQLAGEENVTEEELRKIPDFTPGVGATTAEIHRYIFEDYGNLLTDNPTAAATIRSRSLKRSPEHSAIASAMTRMGYAKRKTNITALCAERKTGTAERWVKVRSVEEAAIAEGPNDFTPPEFITAAEREAEKDEIPW